MFGVIVRSTRERTEKLCIKSVGRETDDIAVLRNACPFAEAVRTMMKVAEIRKWDKYLAIDADVVLIKGWHKSIKERMDKVENFYKMIFLVVDRFIPENIYRGIHLYNSTFHGNIIMALSHTYYTSKPEGNMRHIISNPQIACKDILGYHGFEQWHKDIFNRFALRAIRNPEYIKKYKIFDGKLDLEHEIAKAGWEYGIKHKKEIGRVLDARQKIGIEQFGFKEIDSLKISLKEFYQKWI